MRSVLLSLICFLIGFSQAESAARKAPAMTIRCIEGMGGWPVAERQQVKAYLKNFPKGVRSQFVFDLHFDAATPQAKMIAVTMFNTDRVQDQLGDKADFTAGFDGFHGVNSGFFSTAYSLNVKSKQVNLTVMYSQDRLLSEAFKPEDRYLAHLQANVKLTINGETLVSEDRAVCYMLPKKK